MQESRPSPHGVRFGVFEADLRASELRKHGLKVKLHGRPFQILALLLEHPGEGVTREELRQKLWPADTFVDFDHGLNNAVNKLRDALCDSADNPRFVETLPRHGYRFIAPVEKLDGTARQASSGPVSTQEALLQVSPSRQPALRRRLWLAVGAATAVAAAVGVWLVQHPALPFEERDWVLIASFDNRTGEAVFDGTLEYALERELSNSRFVNVVPRERINDTLQLMKKPLDTSIDAAVGREVALRDGGVRALISGRVEKLDTTYFLSVAVVNPIDGTIVASFSEQATSEKEFIPAVRRISDEVREILGEKLLLIDQRDDKLVRVTTPSLRALQLFSRAFLLMRSPSRWGAIAELMRQALEADPEFASGHITLARALDALGRKDEAAPHFEKAFELADLTPDAERYFILGIYYRWYMEDYEKAAEVFAAYSTLRPNDDWVKNILCWTYLQIGRLQEYIQCHTQGADLRPHNFRSNVWAAHALGVWGDEREQAERYLQRARELASPENERSDAMLTAWLELFPAYEYWLRGEVEHALNEVNRVAQSLPSRRGRKRYWFDAKVNAAYMALGKLEAAEKSFQRLAEPWRRSFALSSVARARGDNQAFRRHLAAAAAPSRGGYLPAIFLAQAGLLVEAEQAIRTAATQERNATFYLEPFRKAALGELALARGQTEEAIRQLEEALEGRPFAHTAYFLATGSLARAWQLQGDSETALHLLEQSYRARAHLYTPQPGMWPVTAWLENEHQRLQILRKLGREEEAREVETSLLRLLAVADSDHFILRQLKRPRESASAELQN